MITYKKLDTGEWVAAGSLDEIRVGPVEIHKRSGNICPRIIDEVVQVSPTKAYGYLTEHCKPQSKAAHDARKRRATSLSSNG